MIGLDFGTAYTKVIVGTSTSFQVIPIGKVGGNENPYLLLGECSFLADNECRLGRHSGRQVNDIKFRLIQGDLSVSMIQDAICMIALILRKARLWVLLDRYQELKNVWIDWVLNVGLPTESYENTSLVKVYKDIVSSAWLLSVIPTRVTVDTAMSAFNEVARKSTYSQSLMPTGGIYVTPEFAAQVSGYLNSAARREGLHLLIDIGAGTIDDTVFNVWEEQGQEVHPIFAKSVSALGVRFLVRHRVTSANLKINSYLDDLRDVPNRAGFASLLGVTEDQMVEIDEPFLSKLVDIVRSDLVLTKKKRHPSAREWKTGINVFLTGGGSRVDVYRELIKKIASGTSRIPLNLIEVPEPRDIFWSLRERGSFDRFMVAYGLAHDPSNIAEIIPSQRVSDFDDTYTQGSSWRNRYVDKDQV